MPRQVRNQNEKIKYQSLEIMFPWTASLVSQAVWSIKLTFHIIFLYIIFNIPLSFNYVKNDVKER